MIKNNVFKGRYLCVASMHKKEEVIAPVLVSALGVRVFTDRALNTDVFGTFSGEVDRPKSPLETARLKCIAAMEISHCDMAVASEGSFGPDPVLGFVNCDEEILYFYDRKNNIELSVKEISYHTNFASKAVTSLEELNEFARKALFPDHALILRDHEHKVLEKGINTWHHLRSCFEKASKRGTPLTVETDMRANFNPSRMSVIAACAQKLVEALQKECPNCQLPGFTVKDRVDGLPCSWCGNPTKSTLRFISRCNACGYERDTLFPHGKTKEDPMYCDYCNP